MEFTWNLFIEFFHFTDFLKMNLYVEMLNLMARNISQAFFLAGGILFNKCFQMLVVNCGWTTSTLLILKIRLLTTEVLKLASYSPIISGSFTRFSVNIGRCLRSIMTQFELKQKVNTSFFSFFSFFFLLFLIRSVKPSNQIPKKVLEIQQRGHFNPEDLPKAMNDREKWQERVRDIHASGTTWWWWWLFIQLR